MTPVMYSSQLIISTKSKNSSDGNIVSLGRGFPWFLGHPRIQSLWDWRVAKETRYMDKKRLPIRPVPAAQDTGKKTTSHGIIVQEGQNNPLSDSARFSNKLSYTLSHKKDNPLVLQ